MKKRCFYIFIALVFLSSVVTYSYNTKTTDKTSLQNSSSSFSSIEKSESVSGFSSEIESLPISESGSESSVPDILSSIENTASSNTGTTSKSNITKQISTNNTVPKSKWPQSGSVPSPVSVPNLDGQSVAENDRVLIDLSYTSYGFVKAKLKSPSQKRIKIIIKHGSTEYRYDLNNTGSFESFPLQMGNGEYSVSVYENIVNTQYTQLLSAVTQVSLIQSNIPYLVPCQIVNYSNSSNSTALAKQLVAGDSNNFGRISAVLTYIAKNITYDYDLAATVKAGYVPDVDHILSVGKGICYDYASVSAAMLRSIGYPTKLITGYVTPNNLYHAWIEVYIDGIGFIKVMEVTVDIHNWSRVDVTFISNASSPSEIEKYVGNGSNYTNHYIY